MLNTFRERFIEKNVQFIFTNKEGIVLKSDQTFVHINEGENITSLHPFFESFAALADIPEQSITFNCVHLLIGDKDLNMDVEMINSDDGVCIILQDLTAHYNTYQTMAQARNESIISEELVVLKNMELEERERFKNTFIQNFSHEIRNPLTSIMAITNILGNTELTSEQSRMIHFMKDSNDNLRLMLEDILSLNMIATGKLELNSTMFSLSKLLALLKFTYTSLCKEKGLQFELISDVKIPDLVEGDRLRLFQVLTNLLDNAIRYTREGSVGLSVQYNQKRANIVNMRFQVIDTGVGIPDDSIDTVFESFEQLPTEQKKEGAGLGLAIVKGLLQLMGSDIKLDSKVGKGSVFYFDIGLLIPLPSATANPIKKGGKTIDVALQNQDKPKYKVLLVEDDERIQMILFKLLMDKGNFYVDLVSDGAKVMETIINETYDLILMDVNLPNVTGDQVTRLIRDFPFKNIKSIPIIGITAFAFEENIKSYHEAGMNQVIVKPFEEEVLLKAISKHLK